MKIVERTFAEPTGSLIIANSLPRFRGPDYAMQITAVVRTLPNSSTFAQVGTPMYLLDAFRFREQILRRKRRLATEGSKTLLQDYFYAAELRAHGMDSKQVQEALTKRFGTAASPNPSRTGVAYMIAPIMRGYTSAPGPAIMNMPHYMFYAPGVKDAEIGGHGFSKQYPFILNMSPGRDDYIILLVGEAEKGKIIEDSKELLSALCSYRKYLCTTPETRARTPVDKTPEAMQDHRLR